MCVILFNEVWMMGIFGKFGTESSAEVKGSAGLQ